MNNSVRSKGCNTCVRVMREKAEGAILRETKEWRRRSWKSMRESNGAENTCMISSCQCHVVDVVVVVGTGVGNGCICYW